MIYQSNNFDDFAKRALAMGISSDLKALLTLDIIFYEEYEDYIILSLTDFDSQPNKLVVLSESQSLIYPEIVNLKHPLYDVKGKKEEFREATVTAYLVLRKLLSNYVSHFEKLKSQIDQATDSLDIEAIEEIDKKLKKFWDVIHDFERLLIELEEKSGMKLVDPEIVGYDYDLLLAKATHLSDRVRGARKEISISRGKCEVRYSKQLNTSIQRLTQVMAFLTIVNVILTVPNTVATMFGVPSLNAIAGLEAYALVMVLTTVASIAISYYYLKKWNI